MSALRRVDQDAGHGLQALPAGVVRLTFPLRKRRGTGIKASFAW
jgi:hypothetical protein